VGNVYSAALVDTDAAKTPSTCALNPVNATAALSFVAEKIPMHASEPAEMMNDAIGAAAGRAAGTTRGVREAACVFTE
jgi:hypothetical protein